MKTAKTTILILAGLSVLLLLGVVIASKKATPVSTHQTESSKEKNNDSEAKSTLDYWGINEEEKHVEKRTEKKQKKSIVDEILEGFKPSEDVEESYEDILEPEIKTYDFADNSERRIVCWGDSMTVGYGGGDVTYPDVLQKASGAEVLNYGVFGETTRDIAAREGCKQQYVIAESDVIIPADCTPIPLNTAGEDGQWPNICLFGNAGMNPTTIAGIEGTFFHDDVTGLKMFARNTPGTATVVPVGTPIYTFASKDCRDTDIVIIWSGNNEAPETVDEVNDVIYWQKKILEHTGAKDYAIVSLTTAIGLPKIDLINEMFKKEYGEHYINLRAYVLGDMMQDAGITPTEKDKEYIAKGYLPPSLADPDEIHGNAVFYEYTGKFIYKELQRMGYLY